MEQVKVESRTEWEDIRNGLINRQGKNGETHPCTPGADGIRSETNEGGADTDKEPSTQTADFCSDKFNFWVQIRQLSMKIKNQEPTPLNLILHELCWLLIYK